MQAASYLPNRPFSPAPSLLPTSVTASLPGSLMPVGYTDGESTGPHASEGKPWPEGEITHDYVWAKTYNIVVTERWTATWSLGGQSGTLRELRTTGRIDNFPAREIQAVIRS